MKTLRRHLVGLPLAGLLALVLPGVSFAAEPQDSFIVSQHGQSVGTASYRFTPTSETELPQEGFALVRKGFELKPPAKPIAPPAESAPPAH